MATWRIGAGGKLLLVAASIAILGYGAHRYLGRPRVLGALGLWKQPPLKLSAGDFPAGSAAPAGNLVSVPLRPIRLAAIPSASAASLLLAAGGTGVHKDAPVTRSYGIEVELSLMADERAIAQALAVGGDLGGADAAALTVDRLAQVRETLRDARLKAVALLARSRGDEAIAAAPGIDRVAALKGRQVAVAPLSPARYLLLWSLTQALLSPADVLIVSAASPAEAVRLFREGRVDAAAGTVTDLAATARDRGGRIIASTADSPHLIATVLVVRSDLLARFPDAVRRLTRAVLDSSEGMAQEQTDAARLLSASAPQLGDPFEALHLDAPATRAENLAFFGIEGDTPVRYDELFTSAAALWRKLGEKADNGLPADSRELGPLIAAGGKSAAPSTGTALGPRPSP